MSIIAKKIANAVDLANYLDYSHYLQDLYRRIKQETKQYSYLQFAEDLGFKPSNVIHLAITGKRQLTQKSAKTIAGALGLRHLNRRYFLALVAYNTAKSASLREKHFKILLELKVALIKDDETRRRVALFMDWARPVVREILRLNHAPKSAQAIRDCLVPEMRVPHIEETLNALIANKMVAYSNEGVPVLTDSAQFKLPNDRSTGELCNYSYQDEMLMLAKECLTKTQAKDREYNALTLCVSEETLQFLRMKLRSLCVEILEIEEKDSNKQCVVQFNSQLFRLTKPE